jgi:DNA glycosylase AlkZ-like
MPTKLGEVLGMGALNRAFLARQSLLERQRRSVDGVIEHLVGMQAQAPDAPYVGLWTRLDGFRHEELAALITARRAVRTPLMRSTVHLVTDRDCLTLRPLMQPVLAGNFRGSPFARHLAEVESAPILAAGRALLEEKPRTRGELAALLGERWPEIDRDALAYLFSYLVPLVQVPPRGIWGKVGPATWTTVEQWLGRALDAEPSVDAVVLRYLAAFGPATVRDAQLWSGLTRLRAVFDRLRPQLITFRDDAGNELFDLPDAPRPDPETLAPARFLPEYDNALLSHADRRRIIEDGQRVPLPPGNGGSRGTVLIDGFFRSTWQIIRQEAAAMLTIEPFAPLPASDRAALEDEGASLLAFAAGEGMSHDIRFAAPG